MEKGLTYSSIVNVWLCPQQRGLWVLADRSAGESQSHSLLYKNGLAPELLARFQNGLMYRFICGQVCESRNLTEERIWRGVAHRLAEWHAVMPLISASPSTTMESTDDPLFGQLPSQKRPSPEAINSITPNKAAPNVWTVMQKWIFALPTTTEAEIQRTKTLQKELERTVADLADIPSLGSDGVCIYCRSHVSTSSRSLTCSACLLSLRSS